MTNQLPDDIKRKMIGVLAKYDVFMDIPNSIVASTEADNFCNDMWEVVKQARQEEREKVLELVKSERDKNEKYSINWDAIEELRQQIKEMK